MVPHSHQRSRSCYRKSFKPHIPVQIVSPRRSRPVRFLTNDAATEDISPPSNYTRLGTAAKKWISIHPPYLTRNIDKELQDNKPIQKKIMAMEKLKTPTKSQPSTPSKVSSVTSSVNVLTPIIDSSPACAVASPSPISLKEKLKSLSSVPSTPSIARWYNKLQPTPSQHDKENTSTSSASHGDLDENTDTPVESLSFPSATDFINKIIHNEIIHGDDPDDASQKVNTSQSDDVLVLDTQPEDYSGLDMPDSEFLIPETQIQSQVPQNTIDLNPVNEISTSTLDPSRNQTLASAVIEIPPKSFPKKNTLSRGLLQIIVPFSDFLSCTEENCSVKFFGQTFSKAIHMLLKHLNFVYKQDHLHN